MRYFYIYLAVISFISFVVTIYDKRAAKKGRRRVSEQTLLMLSMIGGSVMMLVTMLLIRHKTRHIKFMAGIPLIIAVQCFFAWFLYSFVTG